MTTRERRRRGVSNLPWKFIAASRAFSPEARTSGWSAPGGDADSSAAGACRVFHNSAPPSRQDTSANHPNNIQSTCPATSRRRPWTAATRSAPYTLASGSNTLACSSEPPLLEPTLNAAQGPLRSRTLLGKPQLFSERVACSKPTRTSHAPPTSAAAAESSGTDARLRDPG